MKTRSHARLTAIGAAAGALGLFAALSAGPTRASETTMGAATYSVTFVPSWNPATHPHDYPITHAKKGLLTPIIGATHTADFRLFAHGLEPTPGLEKLSEMGAHNPLDDEIRAHVKRGHVGGLIEFADGSPGPVHPPVTSEIRVDAAHPMVSLVGMIAPSPDWFYGVSSVSLLDGGDWVPSAVVTAYAWDSGGDAGTSYLAEDADLETKAATMPVDSPSFQRNGERIPVGVFLFKRVPDAM